MWQTGCRVKQFTHRGGPVAKTVHQARAHTQEEEEEAQPKIFMSQ